MKSGVVKGIFRNLSSSPRKLGLVAKMVRKMPLERALACLEFCPRRVSAKAVRDSLLSLIANAENNFAIDRDSLSIKEISVGKDKFIKRMSTMAKGRSTVITKKKSNLYVSLVYNNEE